MSLKDWLDNGWLKPHQTNQAEINRLLEIVRRDLADAMVPGLTDDWRFGIAYNATLKLCTIVLYAQGFRPENTLAHYRTIMALKEIDVPGWKDYAVYLNTCRMRRNILEYIQIDAVASKEADELVNFASSFLNEVIIYLDQHFPSLLASR